MCMIFMNLRNSVFINFIFGVIWTFFPTSTFSSVDLQLDLGSTITTALTQNHQFLNTKDSIKTVYLAAEGTESYYDIGISPFVNLNQYQDASSADKSYRYGFTVAKNLITGASIRVQTSWIDSGNTDSSNLSVGISQPLIQLLSPVRARSLLDASDFSTQSAIRSFQLERESLVLSAIQAFYRLNGAIKNLEAREHSFDQLTRNLFLVQSKERLGVLDSIDVHRALMSKQTAENQLLSAREGYANSVSSFKTLLGIEQSDTVSLQVSDFGNLFRIPLEEAIQVALENRLEIKQVEAVFENSVRLAKIAKTNLLPDISLDVRYNQDDPFGSEREDGYWTIGISGDTDLRKKSERIQLQQAYLQVNQAKRNIQYTRDQIQKEIETVWRDYRKNEQQVSIQEAQVKSSEGRLKLANLKFSTNRGSNFDVVEAEQEWINARLTLISLQNELVISSYQLMKSLGTLFEITVPESAKLRNE